MEGTTGLIGFLTGLAGVAFGLFVLGPILLGIFHAVCR